MKRIFASFFLVAALPGCAVVPAPSSAVPEHGAFYAQGAPVHVLPPPVYTEPPVRFSFSLGYLHRGDTYRGHHGHGKRRGNSWWGHFGAHR